MQPRRDEPCVSAAPADTHPDRAQVTDFSDYLASNVLLGRGGGGAVFLAKQQHSNELVVIKRCYTRAHSPPVASASSALHRNHVDHTGSNHSEGGFVPALHRCHEHDMRRESHCEAVVLHAQKHARTHGPTEGARRRGAALCAESAPCSESGNHHRSGSHSAHMHTRHDMILHDTDCIDESTCDNNNSNHDEKEYEDEEGDAATAAALSTQNEVSLVRRVGPHPHIVRLLGSHTSARRVTFMAMELMDSDVAREMAQLNKDVHREEVIAVIGMSVLLALHHMHRRGVVHRDVKPANILLQRVRRLNDVVTKEEEEKDACRPWDTLRVGHAHGDVVRAALGDFSAAHTRVPLGAPHYSHTRSTTARNMSLPVSHVAEGCRERAAEEEETDTHDRRAAAAVGACAARRVRLVGAHHASHALRGTLHYKAPEQLLGGPILDYAACDVWSLGCTLYEMATGALAFPGESTLQVVMEMFARLGSSFEHFPAQASPVCPLLQRLRCSDALRGLLGGLLTLDPKQRLSTDAAMRHDFFAAVRWSCSLPLDGRPGVDECDVEHTFRSANVHTNSDTLHKLNKKQQQQQQPVPLSSSLNARLSDACSSSRTPRHHNSTHDGDPPQPLQDEPASNLLNKHTPYNLIVRKERPHAHAHAHSRGRARGLPVLTFTTVLHPSHKVLQPRHRHHVHKLRFRPIFASAEIRPRDIRAEAAGAHGTAAAMPWPTMQSAESRHTDTHMETTSCAGVTDCLPSLSDPFSHSTRTQHNTDNNSSNDNRPCAQYSNTESDSDKFVWSVRRVHVDSADCVTAMTATHTPPTVARQLLSATPSTRSSPACHGQAEAKSSSSDDAAQPPRCGRCGAEMCSESESSGAMHEENGRMAQSVCLSTPSPSYSSRAHGLSRLYCDSNPLHAHGIRCDSHKGDGEAIVTGQPTECHTMTTSRTKTALSSNTTTTTVTACQRDASAIRVCNTEECTSHSCHTGKKAHAKGPSLPLALCTPYRTPHTRKVLCFNTASSSSSSSSPERCTDSPPSLHSSAYYRTRIDKAADMRAPHDLSRYLHPWNDSLMAMQHSLGQARGGNVCRSKAEEEEDAGADTESGACSARCSHTPNNHYHNTIGSNHKDDNDSDEEKEDHAKAADEQEHYSALAHVSRTGAARRISIDTVDSASHWSCCSTPSCSRSPLAPIRVAAKKEGAAMWSKEPPPRPIPLSRVTFPTVRTLPRDNASTAQTTTNTAGSSLTSRMSVRARFVSNEQTATMQSPSTHDKANALAGESHKAKQKSSEPSAAVLVERVVNACEGRWSSSGASHASAATMKSQTASRREEQTHKAVVTWTPIPLSGQGGRANTCEHAVKKDEVCTGAVRVYRTDNYHPTHSHTTCYSHECNTMEGASWAGVRQHNSAVWCEESCVCNEAKIFSGLSSEERAAAAAAANGLTPMRWTVSSGGRRGWQRHCTPSAELPTEGFGGVGGVVM